MSLTRRQKWRIEKVQSERIARANKAAIETEKNITNEELSQKGRVITRYGQRQLVESSTGELFQCTGRQNLGLSVAGDEVIFQPAGGIEGIVTAILPRGNELSQKNKLIATNIDQLWLVVATEPHYQFELIDRYLILAENSNLLITATPSSSPLIQYEWLHKGLHITAMGSDAEHKNELDPRIIQNCDLYVADRQSQTSILGELHHAIKNNLVSKEKKLQLLML